MKKKWTKKMSEKNEWIFFEKCIILFIPVGIFQSNHELCEGSIFVGSSNAQNYGDNMA